MFIKPVIIGFIAVVSAAVPALAQNESIYAQCKEACALNGLSCVNKCLEQSQPAASVPMNQQTADAEAENAEVYVTQPEHLGGRLGDQTGGSNQNPAQGAGRPAQLPARGGGLGRR